jgi:hypothetical protein
MPISRIDDVVGLVGEDDVDVVDVGIHRHTIIGDARVQRRRLLTLHQQDE